MADKAIVNVRERPLSTDIMLIQSLQQRTEAEYRKYFHSTQHAISAGESRAVYPEVMVGGLIITNIVSLTTITIGSGIIMQDSAALVPTPGSYDSTYRMGLLKTPTNVTAPVPGGSSSTWYLLNGQVSEVTTVSESRDIMNPLTGQFESVSVAKVKEWRVVLSWQAGSIDGPNVPSPTTDFVPLYAVRVTAAGLMAAIIDVRPTAERIAPGARRQNWRSQARSTIETQSSPDGVSTSVVVAVEYAISSQDTSAEASGGIVMRALPRVSPPEVIDPLQYLAPGASYTAGGFLFAYMSPWNGLAPGGVTAGFDCAGIFCVSNVPPRDGYNTAPITLPAPWSGYTAPTGTAAFVGLLKRATDGLGGPVIDGWCRMVGKNGVFKFYNDMGNSNRFWADTLSAITRTINVFDPQIPGASVKSVRVGVYISTATATIAGAIGYALTYFGDTNPIETRQVNFGAASSGHKIYQEFEFPFYAGANLLIQMICSVNITSVEGRFLQFVMS